MLGSASSPVSAVSDGSSAAPAVRSRVECTACASLRSLGLLRLCASCSFADSDSLSTRSLPNMMCLVGLDSLSPDQLVSRLRSHGIGDALAEHSDGLCQQLLSHLLNCECLRDEKFRTSMTPRALVTVTPLFGKSAVSCIKRPLGREDHRCRQPRSSIGGFFCDARSRSHWSYLQLFCSAAIVEIRAAYSHTHESYSPTSWTFTVVSEPLHHGNPYVPVDCTQR